MTHGIGHNSNHDPDGYAGRLHLWRRARADLVAPRLPIEIVRMRVRRAAALGLPYKTYASIRATTGRDVIALLFSSNALDMRPAPAPAALEKLAGVAAERGVLVHLPLPDDAPPPLDWAARAPPFTDTWGAMRRRLDGVLAARALPRDGVVMVGATAVEREWCAAARAAGWVSREAYFGG
ncbi:hypothetical protein JQC91_16645 [Jannaschia sp. Os4]|uniref:hypothetical protein n=1 Tax=Jannaschia sp. Os4 TaxID=2807617 RepID=UPI001939BA3B|nr:hypothetical protein [Jannaschia sp. Os4]MBM2577936.1 hypothetical protein [Jannaschia sp. Os4]